MTQIVDDLLFGSHIPTYGRDGLTERAHFDVDYITETKIFFNAGALLAEHAYRMGLIDHEPGVVLPAQLQHFWQVYDVAVHTED